MKKTTKNNITAAIALVMSVIMLLWGMWSYYQNGADIFSVSMMARATIGAVALIVAIVKSPLVLSACGLLWSGICWGMSIAPRQDVEILCIWGGIIVCIAGLAVQIILPETQEE